MILSDGKAALTESHCLFNALDGSLSRVNIDAFNRSLVLNILFQDRLLVYSGSLFTCENLFRHLSQKKDRFSLFEVACKEGLIVPALKDRQFDNLRDAANAQRKDSPGYELPEARIYREQIITAVDNANARPVYCREDAKPLGNSYEAAVRSLLCKDNPPVCVEEKMDRSAVFAINWERTKRWRHEFIDIAVKRTAENGNEGLRRQQIFNILGETLGIETNSDVTYPELVKACGDSKEDGDALEIFLRWLAQCHFVSQAGAFGASINFPVYHHDTDFILDSILRTPHDGPPPVGEGFTCEVYLPPDKDLAAMHPATLVAIRKHLGETYLASLRVWQNSPNETNLEALKYQLQTYCQVICEESKAARMLAQVQLRPGTLSLAGNEAGKLFSGLATPSINIATGGYGSAFFSIAKKGCSMLISAIRSEMDQVIHAPKNQSLEITLPVKD